MRQTTDYPVRQETRSRVRAVNADPIKWMLAGLAALALLLAAAAAQARGAPETFADLAEKLLPSVVNISTTQIVQTSDRMPQMPEFPPGSPFEQFFKDFLDKNGQGGGQRRQKATALGSGFVIDSAGYIVTNNHVIADADEITVILQDDTALKATLVGTDTKTDTALLKVNSKTPLKAVSWGNSDSLRVGDWVMAIGNPFGLGGTVTAGIVSARSRDISSGPYDDFIQTDASINKGNSGGPLFNMNGEVIGINTAIYSPPGSNGGSVGIGFAIASDLAKSVIADLRKYGRTRRGWLGVRIQTVTPDVAESMGLGQASGALVANTSEGGPAANGGIEAGDVILEFDGKEVGEMRRLPRIVAETDIGKTVDVKIWRDGKKKTLRVKVEELTEDTPETQMAAAPPDTRDSLQEHSLTALGLGLAGVNDATRQRYNLADNAEGVVVTNVEGASDAEDKGMRAGDVIMEVNQEKVSTPSDVEKAVTKAQQAGRKSVLLLVGNSGGNHFVALKIVG